MCFSAEADLVAGLVVGAIGIDTVRSVRVPRRWPLATLPLLLAGHQLIEVLVWWGEQGRVSEGLGRAAAAAYLLIAFGVLPVLVPVAVAALEPAAGLRRTRWFIALGVAVAAVLVHAVVRGPVSVSIEGHHLSYGVDLWHGGLLVVLYVFATCGSLLASASRAVRTYGLVNLVAVATLAWVDQRAVISLWCGWAAVTSVAIALHLRRGGTPEHEPVSASPS